LVDEGDVDEAYEFYRKCVAKGVIVPSEQHFNPLLRKSKNTSMASTLLQYMDELGLKSNVFSYTSAIAACESNGDWKGAHAFLERMRNVGLAPNEVTYSCLISVAAQCNTDDYESGKLIHGLLDEMREAGLGSKGVNQVCHSKAAAAFASAMDMDNVQRLLEELKNEGLGVKTQTLMGILSGYRSTLQRYLNMSHEGQGVKISDEGVGEGNKEKDGGNIKRVLSDAVIRLLDDWVCKENADEGIFYAAMDICETMNESSYVLAIYDAMMTCDTEVTKTSLTRLFRSMMKMQSVDGAREVLAGARAWGFATARMYNETMSLADSIGRYDISTALMLDVVDESSYEWYERRQLRPPQKFVRSRILSNALLSITRSFSQYFKEEDCGVISPMGAAKALYGNLEKLLPLEIGRVFLKPAAYPMACKILLDNKDYSTLRTLLNQTLYMPHVNATRIYEFSIKGLILAFPLRISVQTILELVGDCVEAGHVQLGADMLVLTMNRIFNVDSLPRSAIDRLFFEQTWEGRGSPIQFRGSKGVKSFHRRSYVKHRRKGKAGGNRGRESQFSDLPSSERTSSNRGKEQNQAEEVDELEGKHVVRRSDTRERLLVSMFLKGRSILGVENTPVKCYRLACLACQQANLVEKALDVYQLGLEDERLDTFMRNVVVNTLARDENYWETALDIFDSSDVQDKYGYVAALVACETGGDWEQALSLLEKARQKGFEWTTAMVTTAIAVCGTKGRADEALRLLEQSAVAGVRLNAVAFNAAIFACVGHYRGEERWAEAEDLVLFMQERGVWPNRVTYNAIIETLGQSGQDEKVDAWYLDAVTAGVLSPFEDLARHGWVDLHLHSVHMAHAAVRMTFGTLRALFTQDALPANGEIVFIVGKGRKLLQGVNLQLSNFEPPIRCHVHASNLGRLLLNKEDVTKWLEANS